MNYLCATRATRLTVHEYAYSLYRQYVACTYYVILILAKLRNM